MRFARSVRIADDAFICRCGTPRYGDAVPEPSDVVGRDAELAAAADLLDRLSVGPSALVLTGEAGIGKTTVWAAAVARAADRGFCVLRTRPAEAETPMSFTGLIDLLDELPDEALSVLPDPQSRALRVATLRAEPDEEFVDERAIAVGLLSLVRILSRERPVLVAIDDAQWLDVSSASALRFVLRRLAGCRVGFVAAARTGPGVPEANWALDVSEVVQLNGLSPAEIDIVVRARLGQGLPAPVLGRVALLSAGNPFTALEIARSAQAARLFAGAEPSVPASMRDAVRARVAALPTASREAVLYVSAAASPTVELLARLELTAALDDAADQGLVEIDGGKVQLAHPLLGSVAVAEASSGERRNIHSRLAAVVADPEQRARHLALGTVGSNAAAADEIEQAARLARARGAVASAAELWSLAATCTPSAGVADRWRRRVEGAHDLAWIGETAQAKTVLRELLAEVPAGPDRARVLVPLSEVLADEMDTGCIPLMEQALRESDPGHTALLARLHANYAWVEMTRLDVDAALRHSTEVVALAERAQDRRMLALGLGSVAWVESLMSHGVREDLFARGEAIETELGPIRPLARSCTYRAGWVLSWSDRLDEARPRLNRIRALAEQQGDEPSLAVALSHLVDLECRAGSWKLADDFAEQGTRIAATVGHASMRASLLTRRGLMDVMFGRVDPARTTLKEALALARELGSRAFIVSAVQTLGFLEFSLGRYAEADAYLAEIFPAADRPPLPDPGGVWWAWSRIEVLAALGRLDEAEAFCDALDAQGRRLNRPWALTTAARDRAMIAGACGDLDAARSHVAEALRLHDDLGYPFELGRTLLVKGTIERRLRAYAAARNTLHHAREIFDGLDARLWSEKVTEELGRIGGRTRSTNALSDQEHRIAELVRLGRTNREIAAELYVTVRAVEKTLTGIYRKLGVRSRAELVAATNRSSLDGAKG